LRALAASPLGFLIGLAVGALGGGGSILAVPALVYVAGQSPRAATTTSLLVVGAASLAGLADHLRAGRVRVRVGLAFGVVGIGGSLAGSTLNHRLDPDLLLLAFAGVVLVAAWRMLTGCPSCTNAGERGTITGEGPAAVSGAGGDATVLAGLCVDGRTVVKVLLAGTVVGFFTGLFGVGGGFMIVPALTLGLGFAMPEAIGTSLLVMVVNVAVALAARMGQTGIDMAVTVPFTVAAVAGTLTGSRLADRLPARTTLRWFAALLVTIAVYTAVRSLLALT
jgi:uncharacterized protein